MLNSVNLPDYISKILSARIEEILQETLLLKILQIEAFEHAIQIKNQLPLRALKDKITLQQALYNIKLNLTIERIFGSRVYVAISNEERRKTLLQHYGMLTYFVSFEIEAIMRVQNSKKSTILRTTTLRVDNSVGLEDLYDSTLIYNRAP